VMNPLSEATEDAVKEVGSQHYTYMPFFLSFFCPLHVAPLTFRTTYTRPLLLPS
jgi:hypothetical protein